MPVIQDLSTFISGGGLVCPEGRAKIEFSDASEPGLFVEVRASTASVPNWYLRVKNAKGTNEYKKLGSIKDLNVLQARKLAKQHKTEHAVTLKAVASTPVVAKTEMTWDVFYKDHFKPHADATIRSAKKYDQLQRIYVSPRFGTMPLSQVNRRDVQTLHNSMVKDRGVSPATADHVVKYMRRTLNMAVQWDYLEKNPLKNFELFMVDNQVENYLNDEQMQKLLAVLRSDANRNVCQILMLLLSTGARLNEILSATWKNVSMEGRSLKVDAVRSKSKRSRSIPLNDSALWVLDQLDSRGKSDYLFPSPVFAKAGKDLPYTNITRAWYRIQKLAGVKIRVHDLRHGFASMLVSGGRSLYEVQQILGHSDPKITMRYAHLSSKTLQDAANAASVIVPKEVKAA